MTRISPETKVGLFVLGGLLVLVYMTFKVGELGLGAKDGYELYLELDDAAGLAKEGEILVAGIKVGRVENIALNEGKALLTLKIYEDVELPSASLASLRTHGLLGEKYVEIQPVASLKPLREGDYVTPGVPPGDFDKLISNWNEISVDVKHVTERIANVFGTDKGEGDLRNVLERLSSTLTKLEYAVDENREILHESIENIHGLSGDLKDAMGDNRKNIDEAVANIEIFTAALAEQTPLLARKFDKLLTGLDGVVSENRHNLRQTMENAANASAKLSSAIESVNALVASLQSHDGTLGRLINDPAPYEDLEAALKSFRNVLDRVERGEGTLGKLLNDDAAYEGLSLGMKNLENITGKIDSGQGTIGKLVNEDSLHDEFENTLTEIGDFVSAVDKFRIEVGYRGEYLTQLGEARNHFSLYLKPKQDRFYFVSLVDDPRGDSSTKNTRTVVSDKDGVRVVSEEKTTTEDSYKLSLQAGKQFSFITLRGGLMESTGGVGADVDFFADRLRLSLDVFDFSRENNAPHLKASLTFYPLENIFMTGGFDDFLSDSGTADYFVGGGIRFYDDDIKLLLSPAASLAK